MCVWKDTGIQWIRLLNLQDRRGTWGDLNFLFIGFLFCYVHIWDFLVFFWCIVDAQDYVSSRCTSQQFTTFKGYVPPTVTTKCWLYIPCCRTHPCSLFIPYRIVCTSQSPLSCSSLLPSPSWQPLVCFPHWWVCFSFDIFTILFYPLESTYKWYPTAFVFLCLTHFTQHTAFPVYPCCCKWQNFILFYSWVCACSVAQLCLTLCGPMDYVVHQDPLSMGFPGQEYWSGLPFPSPGDQTHISCIGRWILYHWATREALYSWVVFHYILHITLSLSIHLLMDTRCSHI